MDVLVAGRELDALIHTKVMGHADAPLLRDKIPGFVPGKVPHYSTWITDAWLVVEQVHELIREAPLPNSLNYLTLTCLGFQVGRDGWAASFDANIDEYWYEHPEAYYYAGRGATAAAAICRAALKVAAAIWAR